MVSVPERIPVEGGVVGAIVAFAAEVDIKEVSGSDMIASVVRVLIIVSDVVVVLLYWPLLSLKRLLQAVLLLEQLL